MDRFLWWKCLDCLNQKFVLGVWSVDTVGRWTSWLNMISIGKANMFVMPCFKGMYIKLAVVEF